MTPADFIMAARVPASLAPQKFGLWSIDRVRVGFDDICDWVAFDTMTVLSRVSIRTLHTNHNEVVMEDSLRELRRHLPIWMSARGRVLITGLGLGCVVRGLLANPEIDHIDVVEIDADIMRIVGAEFSDNDRVTLRHGDALEIELDGHWDFAWHDLWSDDDNLHLQHAQLILNYRDRVHAQGAWAFPREIARLVTPRLLGAPRTPTTAITESRATRCPSSGAGPTGTVPKSQKEHLNDGNDVYRG